LRGKSPPTNRHRGRAPARVRRSSIQAGSNRSSDTGLGMTWIAARTAGYIRRTSRSAHRDAVTMAAARRRIRPSRRTLGRSDHLSIADEASWSTHRCVQSIETIDGTRRIRSRLAYAVACRWKCRTSK
jgi:hypothetical protein